MKSRYFVGSLLCALAPIGAFGQSLPTPIIQYSFVNGGATNTGSGGSGANLTDASGAATSSVVGPSGSVVSVFDGTSSTGMGSSGTGGLAQSASASSSLTGLQSFTMTGWLYSPSSNLEPTARIFINGLSTNGIIIYSDAAGQLEIKDNATRLLDSSVNAYSTNTGWTFFAVTYTDDSSLLSNFYAGTATSAVTNVTSSYNVAVGSGTNYFSLTGGTTAPVGAIGLGNTSGLNRPYDGYMFDFRVYGSGVDDSGILSQSQIDGIRLSDLGSSAAAPEPTSGMLLAASTFLAGFASHRRRNHRRK